jgi:hypothetical protein
MPGLKAAGIDHRNESRLPAGRLSPSLLKQMSSPFA